MKKMDKCANHTKTAKKPIVKCQRLMKSNLFQVREIGTEIKWIQKDLSLRINTLNDI